MLLNKASCTVPISVVVHSAIILYIRVAASSEHLICEHDITWALSNSYSGCGKCYKVAIEKTAALRYATKRQTLEHSNSAHYIAHFLLLSIDVALKSDTILWNETLLFIQSIIAHTKQHNTMWYLCGCILVYVRIVHHLRHVYQAD